jgi:hypothetical protein
MCPNKSSISKKSSKNTFSVKNDNSGIILSSIDLNNMDEKNLFVDINFDA